MRRLRVIHAILSLTLCLSIALASNDEQFNGIQTEENTSKRNLRYSTTQKISNEAPVAEYQNRRLQDEEEEEEDVSLGPWLNCLQRSFWVCKEIIKEDAQSKNVQLQIETLHKSRPVTMDFRQDRVRIFYNNFGRVVSTPRIG